MFRSLVRPLTRRVSLVWLTVLTLGASLALTGAVYPLPSRPDVEIRSIPLRTSNELGNAPQRVEVPIRVDLIGFGWAGSLPGEVRFRFKQGDSWSAWNTAEADPDEGPDPNSNERRNRAFTPPIWIGAGARVFDVIAPSGARDVRLHAVRSESDRSNLLSAAAAHSTSPGIISRTEWGADESWRTCEPSYASTVRNAIVHHTATDNDYSPEETAAVIRAIYRYHTQANGWCDIGYNFLIDRFGRVYEGRSGGITRPVIGAHAGGFNSGSTGIALIGSFQSTPIPSASRASLLSTLTWKLGYHGVDANGSVVVVSNGSTRYPEGTVVELPNVSGHRDVSATSCPGDGLYAPLPSTRIDTQANIEPNRDVLGGKLESGPDASSWGPGRLDVFVRGIDDRLWHRWWAESRWWDWESLGAELNSDPGAVSWGPNRIDVFAKSAEGNLLHRWWNGNVWSEWESMDALLSSAPDAASWAPNRLDVFARGIDQALWHKWWDGSRWSDWERLGGVLKSDPAAVSWGGNRIDVFARGIDDALWHRWWDGTKWNDWETLGGILESGPDVASWTQGRLDIFVRGIDQALWHKAWTGTHWAEWESLGGSFTSDISAVSSEFNRIDIFARGTDQGLWRKWWADGWFGFWEKHPI